MDEIDIKQEYYLPRNFQIFGAALIIWGLFYPFHLFSTNSYTFLSLTASVIGLVLGLLMLTSRYGLKINVSDTSYTIYTWVLGFKRGKPEHFNYIEKFYINQVRESATLTARSGITSDVHSRTYKAFMLLDNGEKIHVDTHKNEQKLHEKVEKYKKIVADIYRPAGE